MVGENATKEGVLLLSRNEDSGQNNWNKYLTYRKKPEFVVYGNDENSTIVQKGIWTLGNGMKVPVPQHAFAYSAMPDAISSTEASYGTGNHFLFEERGINEKGVALSATNSTDSNAKALQADNFIPNAVSESIIPTLLLPQMTSAKQGVELLGKYVETFGASEGNGVLFGDDKELWYLEIGSGHHWIAVKVPKNKYLVVSNSLRIHSVDLNSKEVLHSKGLFEFVKRHALLKNPNKKRFNFAKAFGILGQGYNTNRIWLAQHLLTPSKEQKTSELQYPLFLKPDKKVSVKKIMSVLRATYKGTPLEGIATRPIGVNRTAESHIITIDPHMPKSMQGIIWQSISTPMATLYMPLFETLREVPKSYFKGDNTYDATSAYWSFRALLSLSALKKGFSLPSFWKLYENRYIQQSKVLKHAIKQKAFINNNNAFSFTQAFSSNILYETRSIADSLRDEIITNATRQNLTSE
jgi:dipeptidase